MTAERAEPSARVSRARWLYDHIGMVSGVFLAVIAFAFIAFLAAIGVQAALGIVVVVVFGVVVIAVGARMRE